MMSSATGSNLIRNLSGRSNPKAKVDFLDMTVSVTNVRIYSDLALEPFFADHFK